MYQIYLTIAIKQSHAPGRSVGAWSRACLNNQREARQDISARRGETAPSTAERRELLVCCLEPPRSRASRTELIP
jgi:hypothetical protein